jgi:hypothetical protein
MAAQRGQAHLLPGHVREGEVRRNDRSSGETGGAQPRHPGLS